MGRRPTTVADRKYHPRIVDVHQAAHTRCLLSRQQLRARRATEQPASRLKIINNEIVRRQLGALLLWPALHYAPQ